MSKHLLLFMLEIGYQVDRSDLIQLLLCYQVPTVSGMEEVNACKMMSLKETCNSKEEGVTEDEAGREKKIAAYFSGRMGFCAPQGLMHTNPDSEVTAMFFTAPERFEMKPTADGRK